MDISSVEKKPPQGALLKVERRLPPSFDPVMDLTFQNLVLKTAASETYVSYELLEVLVHSEGSKKFVAGFVKRKKLGEAAISR
jgi:hypothetical protein